MPVGGSRIGFWYRRRSNELSLKYGCALFPDYTVGDGIINELGSGYTTDQYTVDNGYVRYTVNGVGEGALGDGGTTGSGNLGLMFDPTGSGSYGSDDYITPGNPWEAYAVSADGIVIGGSNSDNGVPINFPTGAKVYAVGGTNNHYVILRGNASDGWVILQYMTLPGEPVIRIKMSYTAPYANRSSVKFMRGTDPDVDVLAHSTYNTLNQRGYGSIPATDLVYSVGQYSGKPLSLYIPGNGFTHNTAVMSSWPTYDFNTILSGRNDGNGDYAITGAWDTGALTAGDTVSVCCYYICGSNLNDIVSAIGS